MPDVTRFTWIIRERTTLAHIRGVLLGLEEQGAVDLAEVRIVTVDEGRAVSAPAGVFGGTGADVLITVDNLPPEGILFQPEN